MLAEGDEDEGDGDNDGDTLTAVAAAAADRLLDLQSAARRHFIEVPQRPEYSAIEVCDSGASDLSDPALTSSTGDQEESRQ